MTKSNILFIGGGNMTAAIVMGLIKNKYPPHLITIIDRNPAKCQVFENEYKVKTAFAIDKKHMDVDAIVLSIKPQSAEFVCENLKSLLDEKPPLLISVMAGLEIKTLRRWLDIDCPFVRAMPNTPAKCQLGATGLFANAAVTEEQRKLTEALLSSTGIIAWLNCEKQIDTITALSGSGPAYFFYFIEQLAEAAIEMGLPETVAREFSIQTAYGAAALALESSETPASLRKRVTSKGGTTAAALSVFEEKLPLLVRKAMHAASNRATELSEELACDS